MKFPTFLTSVAFVSIVVDAQTPAAPPDVPQLSPISGKDATVKRVRYGPYKLKTAVGTSADPKGVKTSIIKPSVQKPCTDCTLVRIKGGIQYENGTEAIGPAVYLHHAAIINTGPEAKDGTCRRPAYDLFFSTGNERSVLVYNNPNATKPAGYYVHESDNFIIQSEMINNELEEKQVWIYFDYEYIPSKPLGHQQTKVVWLSAASKPCEREPGLQALLNGEEPKLGAGEMYPPNATAFSLKSQPWISPWTGNFVALGGHVHDGGVNIEIYQNDILICDSQAMYAVGKPSPMAASHHKSSATARHLSSMSGCRSSSAIAAGDKFHLVANYDFDKNPGMKDKDDQLLPIMAAATLFIGAN